MMRVCASGLLLLFVEAAWGQAEDWEPCDVASCKCAGYCLESLKGTSYKLQDSGGAEYVVSICEPLDPSQDPSLEPAGSLHCDGCAQLSPVEPSPPNCTAVRVMDGKCIGLGTSDKTCRTGFMGECGMSGQAMADGGLKIRYQYEFAEQGESTSAEFILTLKGGSVQRLGNVSSDGSSPERLSSTWELQPGPLRCAAPPQPPAPAQPPAAMLGGLPQE